MRTINMEKRLVRQEYQSSYHQVWMVSCSTSGRPVVKERWRDPVVEFVRTLSEVQSVEDRQASNVLPMSQGVKLAYQRLVTSKPFSSALNWVKRSKVLCRSILHVTAILHTPNGPGLRTDSEVVQVWSITLPNVECPVFWLQSELLTMAMVVLKLSSDNNSMLKSSRQSVTWTDAPRLSGRWFKFAPFSAKTTSLFWKRWI